MTRLLLPRDCPRSCLTVTAAATRSRALCWIDDRIARLVAAPEQQDPRQMLKTGIAARSQTSPYLDGQTRRASPCPGQHPAGPPNDAPATSFRTVLRESSHRGTPSRLSRGLCRYQTLLLRKPGVMEPSELSAHPPSTTQVASPKKRMACFRSLGMLLFQYRSYVEPLPCERIDVRHCGDHLRAGFAAITAKKWRTPTATLGRVLSNKSMSGSGRNSDGRFRNLLTSALGGGFNRSMQRFG